MILKKSNILRVKTDVLVIGGGCAAARVALEARAKGVEVIMLVKGTFGKCGATSYRVSDIGSFSIADGCGDPDDNPEFHFQETMDAGMGMCDPTLVRILVENAPQIINDFNKWGIHFMKQNGKHLINTACFGHRPRMHIVQGFGFPVMSILKEKIFESGIQVLSKTMVAELAVHGGRCVGVLALGPQGEVIAVNAGATILATGGAGQLFRHTLYPADLTGDGYAMALRAGASLINMEFMQMGIGAASPKLLIGNWVWPLYPKVVDSEGQSIFSKHLPSGVCVEECMNDKSTHWPFSFEHSAKHIDIVVFKEVCGNGDHPVFLDLRDKANEIPQDHPLIGMRYQWLLSHGIDIRSDLISIINYSHSFGGGVLVDSSARTTLLGLYVAGEAAGGMHGANRVGGNMLLACQVFGARAGFNAAIESRDTNAQIPSEAINRLFATLYQIGSSKNDYVVHLRQRLKRVFWTYLMVVRNEKGLVYALDEVRDIRQNLTEPRKDRLKNLKQLLELRNLLDVGEVVVEAALRRKESRGSHHREDFPIRDEERFGIPTVVRSVSGRIKFRKHRWD